LQGGVGRAAALATSSTAAGADELGADANISAVDVPSSSFKGEPSLKAPLSSLKIGWLFTAE